MNHKLNKKKVAFVIIIAVLIISLGVFLFNNNVKPYFDGMSGVSI